MFSQYELALLANGGYCFLFNVSLIYWFLPGFTPPILQVVFPKLNSTVNYLYDKPCLKVYPLPFPKKERKTEDCIHIASLLNVDIR